MPIPPIGIEIVAVAEILERHGAQHLMPRIGLQRHMDGFAGRGPEGQRLDAVGPGQRLGHFLRVIEQPRRLSVEKQQAFRGIGTGQEPERLPLPGGWHRESASKPGVPVLFPPGVADMNRAPGGLVSRLTAPGMVVGLPHIAGDFVQRDQTIFFIGDGHVLHLGHQLFLMDIHHRYAPYLS